MKPEEIRENRIEIKIYEKYLRKVRSIDDRFKFNAKLRLLYLNQNKAMITSKGFTSFIIPSKMQESNVNSYKNTNAKKPVIQMDLEGNYINEFDSITEASRITLAKKGSISKTINGRTHTAGGYKWKFKSKR